MVSEKTLAAGSLKRADRPKSIYLNIVEQIQQSIRDGDLVPGDQLLPERELAEQFGVSRASIRQALAVLENNGAIEITPRDGAYIRRQRAGDAIEPLAHILYQERDQVAHLFELRRIIETQAACLAARRRTTADIERLRQLNQQFETDLHNRDSAFQANTQFHIAIVETAQNPLLTEVMTTILTATITVYATPRQESLANTNNRLRFVAEHEDIIRAIERQDETLACDLVAQHIDAAQQRIAAIMQET